MKKYKIILSTLIIIIIIINTYSLLKPKTKFRNLIKISKSNFMYIDKININEVYSNSFGFIAQKKIKIPKGKVMKLIKIKTNEIIFFNPQIVKFKDSLFFLQSIDWITLKKRKIEKGIYNIYIKKQ